MSKAVSDGQTRALSASFIVDTPWNKIQGDPRKTQAFLELTPPERGRCFAAFVANGCKMLIGDPKIIPINRSTPLELKRFLSDGWRIDEEDTHSLCITELNLGKVEFKDMLERGESSVRGEEKLKRVKKTGYIRLDAQIFHDLWENQEWIPASWKAPIGGQIRCICFTGTVLKTPERDRAVLYLYWNGNRWAFDYEWLDNYCRANNLSAVLAS